MNVKKFLAVALSVLMIISVMPFASFAAGNTLDVATGADLKTQVAAAEAGDTIRFTNDITFAAAQVGFEVNKDLTFDLNGHTIYATANGSVGKEVDPLNKTEVMFVTGSANVIFMDSQGGGSFTYTYAKNSAAYFVDARENSVITVNSGSYTTDRSNYGGYIFYARGNAQIVINGGTFTTIDANTNKRDGVIASTTATTEVEINGGTFVTSKSTDYAVSNAGTTEINDGDFSGALDLTASKTTITGGTFKTYDGTAANGAVAKYLPTDKVIDANGEIADVAATTVAKIDSAEYETLAAALAAVGDGATATITLLKDCSLAATTTIEGNQKITINMNGNDITCPARVFNIRHGQLTLDGTGTLYATFTGANAAVAVYGATTSSSNYSVFTLNKNVTIEALNGYGAMIGANGNASYGAKLQINGTINSKYGLYINGNVAEPDVKTNAATINVNGTVNADSENSAIYAAGYAKWNLNATAVINGGSGVYIKSGQMTINGATITATGEKTDYAFNGNGANPTGDAVIVDSCGYPGNVPTVTIKAGTITSANGAAVASYTKQDDPTYADAEFERVTGIIPATSTAVFSSDVTALAADGYKTSYDATAGGYVVIEADAVAEVAGVKYATFEEALAAISTVTSATHSKATDPTYEYKTYVADGTIKLLDDCTSNGIIIGSGSDLTIDFNGHTLDINANPVGSNGTETIGMQLLKDSDITFQNGTLTSTAPASEKIIRLIQNYSNLTFDNMNVGMTGRFYNQDTISHANGALVINDSTVSAPDFSALGYSTEQAAASLGAEAFTLGTFSSYTAASATVTGDSTINGNVSVDVANPETATNTLTLTSGTLNGDIAMKDNADADSVTVTKEDTFTQEAPADYKWESNGDGTSSLVPKEYVAEVAGVKYESFEEALAAISTVTTSAPHTNGKTYDTYVANGEIKLLANVDSKGLIIGSGSDLTIDFNGYTLDIVSDPVGSNNTETIGMQLLKDSDITFKNGTLTSTAPVSEKIVRLIQNYSNLTLDNMNVGMTGYYYDQMTLSHCNGELNIQNGSTLAAPDFSRYGYSDAQAAESLGTRAFALGTFSSYTAASADVTDSTIKGTIKVDVANPGAGVTNTLTLTSGTLTGDIDMGDNADAAEVTKENTFNQEAPEGYRWVNNGDGTSTLDEIEEIAVYGVSLSVEDSIRANFYIPETEVQANEITGINAVDADGNAVAVIDKGVVDGNHLYQIVTVARQMNDEFTVTPITAKEGVEANERTLSVVDYVKAVLASEASNAVKAMLVDMLAYGSAAQDYLGYNTDAKAIDELTAEELAYASDYSDADLTAGVTSASSTGNGVNRITGATVQFADNANIVFKVNTTASGEDLVLLVNGVNTAFTYVQTGAEEVSIIVPQSILGMKDAATFQVGDSNVVTYSVGTYCAWAMSDSADAQAVSRALLTFGTSAIAAL